MNTTPDGIGIVLTTTPQNLDAVGKKRRWTYLVTFADHPSGAPSPTCEPQKATRGVAWHTADEDR
jgi:hypothetical protein